MYTKYTYCTAGVCCKQMSILLDKNNRMIEINFIGGCPGNLNALKKVLEGSTYMNYLGRFKDNTCGQRHTSCMSEFDKFLTLIDEDVRGIREYPYVKEIH